MDWFHEYMLGLVSRMESSMSSMSPMNEILITSAILNPLFALGAFYLVWLMLRHLDVSLGFSLKEWIKNAPPQNVATYLGYRILAVCILVGLIVQPPL